MFFRVCCIFLAGKLEEHYNKFVHLKELADICNPYTQKEVLDMEVVLIEVSSVMLFGEYH